MLQIKSDFSQEKLVSDYTRKTVLTNSLVTPANDDFAFIIVVVVIFSWSGFCTPVVISTSTMIILAILTTSAILFRCPFLIIISIV